MTDVKTRVPSVSASDPLPAEVLYHRCDPDQFDFETTDELDATDTLIVGQARAEEAVQFGIGIEQSGYNIFALGPAGMGRRVLVRHFLEQKAREKAIPPDWCYVNNFDDEREPQTLQLPPGRGCKLKKDMDQFIEDLRTALPAAFESEEYQLQRQAIQEEVHEEQEEALEDLQERAREEDIALIRTPQGFAFAPIRDGEVISPEQAQSLTDEDRERLQKTIDDFQDELRRILRRVPQRQRELRQRLRELNQEVAQYAVGDLLNALRDQYNDLEQVVAFLDAIQEDIVDNVEHLISAQQEGSGPFGQSQRAGQGRDSASPVSGDPLRRYRVNVIVDHKDSEEAPVVYEDNPNYQNLVGQIEQVAMMGTLVTDFNLIKAGALHRANGGYLILEARKLLTQPYAWEGFKRALFAGKINIESPGQALGLISTVSLEPEPIPLDLKIVLVGERFVYYLLNELDPDFSELFKVMADFDERTERSPESHQRYAELLAHIVKKEDLHPFDRTGVARLIEQAARLVGESEKLSTHMQSLTDLAREADYWAKQEGQDVVTRAHVQQAIDAQIYRADRVRERIQEEIERETIYISTEGTETGQINGLSVLQLGGFAFGKPNRITARVRLGKGEIIDIEREAALSGPLHSKGVLILSGFLSGRYAQERPLSLSASLVFEQSYGGIDGDSASSAELFALLSAIAEVPIKQSLAVTGSVNQHGQIQPIGGVNEKIEGFFDTCTARGLTEEQGVIIPAANVKHLMLRQQVVDAVDAGTFHIYPIETIDQGIELLTDLEAGARDEQGTYPDGSFNARVEQRLAEFAERRQQFIMTNGQQETGDV